MTDHPESWRGSCIPAASPEENEERLQGLRKAGESLGSTLFSLLSFQLQGMTWDGIEYLAPSLVLQRQGFRFFDYG